MGKSKNKYTSFLPEQVLEEVSQYAKAAVELYGIISLGKLTEIINSQNEYKVTSDDIKYVCKNFESLYCYVHEGNIVHESLLIYEDDGDYENILEKQDGKPYKIPDKNTFLNHVDDNIHRDTEKFIKLRKYLVAEVEIIRDIAEIICDDLYIGADFGCESENIMFEFTKRGIYPTFEQRKRILELHNECRNKTPIWENRGYSYEELGQIGTNNEHKDE